MSKTKELEKCYGAKSELVSSVLEVVSARAVSFHRELVGDGRGVRSSGCALAVHA